MKKNIQYDKYNYFCYIGVFQDKDYEPVSLILDTQIVIMLERFYYRPHKLESKVNAAITHFLVKLLIRIEYQGLLCRRLVGIGL